MSPETQRLYANKSERDLLIELMVDMKNIKDTLVVASSDVGFARCATHTEKIATLERSRKWFVGGFVSTFVALLGSIFVSR